VLSNVSKEQGVKPLAACKIGLLPFGS